MLKMISSNIFIESMIIVTCIYYVIVLVKYYYKELKNLLTGGSQGKEKRRH